MTAFQIFMHFLAYAQHFAWVAFAPDSAGNGNHVVYEGNVVDCIHVSQQYLANGIGAGAPATHVCVQASSVPF